MLKYSLYENGNIVITAVFDRQIPDKSNGKKDKTYSIDKSIYRKIASSAVNLWNSRANNITFFTLTFPFKANESEANTYFSKYVENLKLTYGLKNYIATKERGEQGGLLHYHCLFDLPYVDIKKLNKAWCNTFKDRGRFSPNAVTLPPRKSGGALVRTQERCVKYLCKYVSKSINQKFKKPCYFISREILSKPQDLSFSDFVMLVESCESFKYSGDYFQVVALKNAYFPKSTEKRQKKNKKTH